MLASQVCHKFFSQPLNSLHQYRKIVGIPEIRTILF